MKKTILFPLSILAILTMAGCSNSKSPDEQFDPDLDPASGIVDGGTQHVDVVIGDTPTQPSVNNTEAFSLTDGNGVTLTPVDNIYTITAAGTYKASGLLENGQILINAGDDDEVVIELNGATITCNSDSPIKVLNADKLEISAKKNSSNKIIDARSTKPLTGADESLGEGAIHAKCDLKLKGAGTLVIEANYNNGVHTTKDLDIQKETLHVTAVNNALKGKCSITMISGTVTAISKNGDGLKTDETDLSSKGKQRGNISINGGTLFVDAVYDGLDAAHNIIINEENEDSLSTNITVKTGTYSTYKTNYSSVDTSSKGLKSDNDITISGGNVAIKATEDAIHVNYGEELDNGEIGQGTCNVTGGNIGLISGDDGIHADNTLNISGGFITVSQAQEGIEANFINITGGDTQIYGSDDGVNASNKINKTPQVTITGGFLDVAVSRGDTDGIDSNGNFKMTGGLVVTRGAPNNADRMSTGLDCDGTASISGGTLIAFNGLEKTPSRSSEVMYAYYGTTQQGGHGGHGGQSSTSGKFAKGIYTLKGDNFTKIFENIYEYSTFLVYSNEMAIDNSYSLLLGESQVLSWTQNSATQKIS